MSLVHRVILLNKPLKIWGMTVFQLIMAAVFAVIGFAAFSMTPKEWKVLLPGTPGHPNSMPAGMAIGGSIGCIGLVIGFMLQSKPIAWWRNRIVYSLKLVPTLYLPHCEPGTIYPDQTIIDPGRKEDRPYVEQEDRPFRYDRKPEQEGGQ